MLFFWLAFGCAQKQVQSSVASIHFQGNGHSLSATSDYVLRSVMEQEKSLALASFRPKERLRFYEPETLRLDAWRLENWYASQGYINARVLGWDVHTVRQRWWDRAPRVSITGFVDEGKPVLIRSIQWEGASKNILRRELEKQLYVEVGQPLLLSNLEYSEEALRNLFQNRSYARATVDIIADIWPANCYTLQRDTGTCLERQIEAVCSTRRDDSCKRATTSLKACDNEYCLQSVAESYPDLISSAKDEVADIIIQVTEGESCTFGSVNWETNTTIDLSVLLDQVPFDIGEAYQIQKVAKLQQRLFALNQFSVVRVTPILGQEGTEIPIQAFVSERKPQQMRLGFGGNIDSGLYSTQLSLDYSHINLLNRLLRVEWSNTLGYSIYPNSIDRSQFSLDEIDNLIGFGGPVIISNIQLNYPRFIRPYWEIGLEIDYERGVQPSYQFSAPTIAPFFAVKKPLGGRYFSSIDARLSYYFTNFSYLNLQVEAELLEDKTLGLDVQENFSLAYVGPEVVLDGRNDPLLPRHGQYTSLALYAAGLIFGGEYDYWEIDTDYRYFYSLLNLGNIRLPGSQKTLRRWRLERGRQPNPVDGVLAMRASAGALLPYQETSDNSFAPYSQHLFLGGSNDVRGWKAYHLGPYLCQEEGCLQDGVQQNTNTVPLGGKAALFSSVEYRQYFQEEYGIAIFGDTGMVWERLHDVTASDLQPSIGAGLRYISPIGPIRLDVACRLKEEPIYQAEDKCRAHFAFSESY